jgi:hypothetical protein
MPMNAPHSVPQEMSLPQAARIAGVSLLVTTVLDDQ